MESIETVQEKRDRWKEVFATASNNNQYWCHTTNKNKKYKKRINIISTMRVTRSTTNQKLVESVPVPGNVHFQDVRTQT